MQLGMRRIIPRPLTILFLYLVFGELRKILIFGDKGYRIYSKTIDSFFKPEFHHVIDLLSHLRVFPVKIWLLDGKNVQVKRICFPIVLPSTSLLVEETWAMRRSSFFCRPPMIVVAIWIIPAAS